MSGFMARQVAWLHLEQSSRANMVVRNAERGRGNGVLDIAPVERNQWNSDDEDVDEYGRRKKKRAKKNDGETQPASSSSASEMRPETGPQAISEGNGAQVAVHPQSGAGDMPTGDLDVDMSAWVAWVSGQQALLSQEMGNFAEPTERGNFATPEIPPAFAGANDFGGAVLSGAQQVALTQAAAYSAGGPLPWGRQAMQTGPVIYSQDTAGTPTRGNLTLEELHARLPCKFFAEGRCKDGKQCQYRHVVKEEARSVAGLKARRYCNYFGAGKCLRGTMCPYIHGAEEFNSKPSIEDLARSAGAQFVDFETGKPKESPVAAEPSLNSQPTLSKEDLPAHLTMSSRGTIRLKIPPTGTPRPLGSFVEKAGQQSSNIPTAFRKQL